MCEKSMLLIRAHKNNDVKEKKSTNVEVNRDNFGIFKKLLDV